MDAIRLARLRACLCDGTEHSGQAPQRWWGLSDSHDSGVDPAGEDESELGRAMVEDPTELGSLLAQAYRGEIDRVVTWRQRIDQTTTWAVTVLAAILTWAFSSSGNPHYILLIGFVVVTVFLGIEARRYRYYDVFRSRVRILQENLFANALDRSRGVEIENWRVALSRDYRRPRMRVSVLGALANRLRRVYLALLSVLTVAWVVRITAFSQRRDWVRTASIGRLPGSIVLLVLGVVYLGLLGITVWPHGDRATGTFREGETDEWTGRDH